LFEYSSTDSENTVVVAVVITKLLSRRSRQQEGLSALMLSNCSSVCLFVCLSPKRKKTFSQKLSNLEL